MEQFIPAAVESNQVGGLGIITTYPIVIMIIHVCVCRCYL